MVCEKEQFKKSLEEQHHKQYDAKIKQEKAQVAIILY